MPSFKHVVACDYKPTFRSQKVAGMFDVPVQDRLIKEWNVNIPIEERPWKVGLIIGASGSGKTTLATKLFKENLHTGFEWKNSCLLDDFSENLDVKDITETLSKVGFSSPPSWLLPYSALSNGQKFRVELARCLLEYETLFVFDEFTSVVDRQVAQIGAHAFSKAIKKTNKQFVAITCHYDIEEWLEPDWVFDVSSNEFKWGSLRRPKIELKIFRCHRSAWKLFKEHHYLSAEINNSAICFVGTINDRPVVFSSWINHFGVIAKDKSGAVREHRTVCLPDFQGLGLGYRLFTEIAKMWATLNYSISSGTSHPAKIRKMVESKEWILKSQGRSLPDNSVGYKRATNRLIANFQYIGDKMSEIDAQRLLCR